MSELVSRAIRFATQAHERIDHRRKYSGQPYTDHLKQVAEIVGTVTDDQEMIAAAWLHDVVEDTPATIDDIEREFGLSVARLVHSLTDISKPSDGNRAERKAIDRAHLANACHRAQTIKLADLIDNCQDITHHDPRFATLFLKEMDALLEVLDKADPTLMRRARKTLSKCRSRLDQLAAPETQPEPVEETDHKLWSHFRHQFNGIFTAKDIAELLEFSFDADMPASQAGAILQRRNFEVATIRLEGEIKGFTTLDHLGNAGTCGMAMRPFAPDQVVTSEAGFAEVIHVLTRHDHCFVSQYGQVLGLITRGDVNKPYMRMWLFGIITLTEMRLTELIRQHYHDKDWQALLSPARLEAARKLQQERRRLGQHPDLTDCLQMADKGQLIIQNDLLFTSLGFPSKSSARKVLKQFQSLRNNLAHAQDISTYDWAQIARMANRMLE